MTTIEERALALINEDRALTGDCPLVMQDSLRAMPAWKTICRALEQLRAEREPALAAIAALDAARGNAEPVAFQDGVADWMKACFGETISGDQLERADRFTEEALELAQTMPGFTADRAHALVDYVFGRAVGDRNQEVGGVMVTLAALCNTVDLNFEVEGRRELERIWTKVAAIRAKQAGKPTGSALPVAHPPQGDRVARVVEWLRSRDESISDLVGHEIATAIERGEPFNG